LVVDLDGTLTPTDTLAESVIKIVKQSPLNFFLLPLWLMRGRAAFKSAIASRLKLPVESLPYREELLAYLRNEKQQGRRIILATAAHRTIADAVATHLGFFDEVLATDEDHNLKGRHKLKAIQDKFGREFVYAGDSRADIPIWKAAKGAVLVGVSPGVAETVRRNTPVEVEFTSEGIGLGTWVRALRLHQWIKNLLLFVPLLTSFSLLDVGRLTALMIAFFAFSLTASATYVVNDLWDLDSDRAHHRKRHRPFASGDIPIAKGLLVAGSALVIAFLIALNVSQNFLLMLLLYLVLSSAYSWVLKRYVLIDVLTLSVLYTLRILAGSVVIEVSLSYWLLAFSVFTFLSLALMKRCSELVSLSNTGQDSVPGRDYRVADLVVLWPLGVGSAVSAVVVFGLFINAPETLARYAAPELLWLAALGLIYWLSRLWIKTTRGEMHDDPIVFAVKDKGSISTILLILITMIAAHYVTLGSSL
jgi:4-hydroxybenzoate polyprenyltransferase/phosphoserine phosphatase